MTNEQAAAYQEAAAEIAAILAKTAATYEDAIRICSLARSMLKVTI